MTKMTVARQSVPQRGAGAMRSVGHVVLLSLFVWGLGRPVVVAQPAVVARPAAGAPSQASSSLAARTMIRGTGGSVVGRTKDVGKLRVVEVDSQISIALPESRVSSLVTADQLDTYRQQVKATDLDDPAAVYDLAIWCGQNRLREQKRYWLQRVIVLDPNHRLSRKALGYVEHAGRWVKFEVMQRKFGLVKVGRNRWEVPEIIAREDAAEKYDRASKLWKKDLQRMVTAINRDQKTALAELNAINDPMASQAISDRLQGKVADPTNLRLLWVRLLGQLRTRVAVEALVKLGWRENDRRVREACLEQLQEHGRSSAIATYTGIIRKAVKDRKTHPSDVRRAALALQSFPDPEYALLYADALVTELIEIGPPGASMNVGFGNNGGGGMQTGGGPNVKVEKSENLEVRNLLKLIEPGVDYGFDEIAWKLHFAGKRSRFEGDLRRDP